MTRSAKASSGRRRKPQPSGESKLDEILRVAARKFHQHGFDAASLDDIAGEVGLHKATLYHYVRSKHDILYQCLSRSFADYDQTLERIKDTSIPVRERLAYFFTTFANAQLNEYGRCVSAVGAQALRHEEGGRIRTFQRGLNDAVKALLREGIDAGEFRPVHVETASALIFGAFHWIWRWYQPDRSITLQNVVDTFLDFFLHGFAASHVDADAIDLAVIPDLANVESDGLPAKHHDILRAAAQCFTDLGYEGTTLNVIAAKVKLHKATLYHYVPGKEAILFQCLRASFAGLDTLEERIADPALPADQRFALFLNALMRAQNNEVGRCLNLIGPHPLTGEYARKIIDFQKRLETILRKILADAVAIGAFRDLHAGLVAAYVFGATNRVPHWFHPGPDRKIETVDALFRDLFLNGILAR